MEEGCGVMVGRPPKLYIIAPVIEQDLPSLRTNLLRLVTELNRWQIEHQIVIVAQIEDGNLRRILEAEFDAAANVLFSKIYNVSHARNVGLDFVLSNGGSGRVLFLDATVSVDGSVWSAYLAPSLFSEPFWMVDIKWNLSEDNGTTASDYSSLRLRKLGMVSAFYKSYVWASFITTDLIKDIRFDERFGVGRDAFYQGGEDVLFLRDIFVANRRRVVNVDGCFVYHPPRDSDYSKHLKYAKGTGAMLANLLGRHESRIADRFVDLGLTLTSFLNAAFRCLQFKQNSFQILGLRVAGFYEFSNRRRFGRR